MAEQSRHAKEYTRSSHSTQEAESSSWVYETFKKKRCSHYIPCKEEPNRCGCGRSKASHDSTKKDGPTNRKHELTEPGQASRTELNVAYMRLPVSLLRRGFPSKNINVPGRSLFPLPIVPYALFFSLSPASLQHKEDYAEEGGPRVQF